MTKTKDTLMLMICALILSTLFLMFAFFAIFSQTARWDIEQAMNQVGEILSEGEDRRIKRYRENQME